MSEFQELFTYQANNSIVYILQEFKENLGKGTSAKHVVSKFYSNLFWYTSLLKDKKGIRKLRTLFHNCVMIDTTKEDNPQLFEKLVENIVNNKNERDILQLAIELAREYESGGRLKPAFSNVTYTKNKTEGSRLGLTAKDMEVFLKSNLQDNVFCAIPNFWDHFFEGKEWTDQASRIWESYNKYEVAENELRSKELKGKVLKDVEVLEQQHGAKEEKILVKHMEEKEMWDWLKFFEDKFLNQLTRRSTRSTKYPITKEKKGCQLRGQYCRTELTKGAELYFGKAQIDFLIKSLELRSDNVDWKNMNVVGEFTQSRSQSIRKGKFLQLSRCVREVFYAQPLRRFMHGFCMFHEEFELWFFDRSGAYSSGRKSIVDSKEMFVRALCSYLLMSDEELGRDTSIYQINGHSHASFTGSDGDSSQLFEIKSSPVVRPQILVTRGTTCYMTRDRSTMIKYSWSRSETNAEAQYMKEAQSVPGVVKYITSELVYQTSSHLESLNLSHAKAWDLKGEDPFFPQGTSHQKSKKPSLERDRFLFRIAMTPCGRKLYSGGSILASVAGIRDAIKAHQGLVNIGILHGDISEGNILLKDPTPDDDLRGMLIDFDFSARLQGDVAVEEKLTMKEALKFMALERMEYAAGLEPSIRRNYRHDLESFSYVLIVGCIENELVPVEETRNLDAWCVNDNNSCYSHKLANIIKFELLLKMFTPSFKGLKDLARNLKTILFRGENLVVIPEDREFMYSRIIEAFDETIEDLRAGRIKNVTLTARRK